MKYSLDNNNKRILAGVINVLLILFAPYWLYLPALFISTIFLQSYWEAIIFGILIDTLYGKGGSFFAVHTFGILFLLIVIIELPLRKRFRFNA